MPRGNYRLRLAQAVAKAAPTMTERDLYTVWKDDPDLMPIARTIHNVVCDARLGQLDAFVGQPLQEGLEQNNNIERY